MTPREFSLSWARKILPFVAEMVDFCTKLAEYFDAHDGSRIRTDRSEV